MGQVKVDHTVNRVFALRGVSPLRATIKFEHECKVALLRPLIRLRKFDNQIRYFAFVAQALNLTW